jgi:hypothetical protein
MNKERILERTVPGEKNGSEDSRGARDHGHGKSFL